MFLLLVIRCKTTWNKCQLALQQASACLGMTGGRGIRMIACVLGSGCVVCFSCLTGLGREGCPRLWAQPSRRTGEDNGMIGSDGHCYLLHLSVILLSQLKRLHIRTISKHKQIGFCLISTGKKIKLHVNTYIQKTPHLELETSTCPEPRFSSVLRTPPPSPLSPLSSSLTR